jgi:N-acetylmuramoyl-L-alanine amidase
MVYSFLISFLLKSVIASGLFILFYWLFLRNRRLNNYNRFFLLASLVVSLALPFLHFQLHTVSADNTAIKLLGVINSNEMEKAGQSAGPIGIDVATILMLLYFTVSAVLVVAFCLKLIGLYKIKQNGLREDKGDYIIVHTSSSKAPFSYLRYIFWNDEIEIDAAQGQQVLKHELAHVRQLHTLDKLFVQLVLIVFWINPFYWFIQRELSITHEFIADDASVGEGNTEGFALMLLQAQFGNSFSGIINPFFHSPIKRRIMMLQQNVTKHAMLRKLAVLPLMAGVVVLLSFSKAKTHMAERQMTLILDAGHGGNDKGAVATNGTQEKDIALKVTNRIKDLATEYNIKVVQTRPDDNYITLNSRADMANEKKGDVFLSIHINEKQPQGYEVLIGKKNTSYDASRILASSVIADLNSINIHPALTEKSLLVLNNVHMPAILIECGDINNSDDMALLCNNESLDKFCRNVLDGVVKYENAKR